MKVKPNESEIMFDILRDINRNKQNKNGNSATLKASKVIIDIIRKVILN